MNLSPRTKLLRALFSFLTIIGCHDKVWCSNDEPLQNAKRERVEKFIQQSRMVIVNPVNKPKKRERDDSQEDKSRSSRDPSAAKQSRVHEEAWLPIAIDQAMPLEATQYLALKAQARVQDDSASNLLAYLEAQPGYKLQRLVVWDQKTKVFSRCLNTHSMLQILKLTDFCSDHILDALAALISLLPSTYMEGAPYMEGGITRNGAEITKLMNLVAKAPQLRVVPSLKIVRKLLPELGFKVGEANIHGEFPHPHISLLIAELLNMNNSPYGLKLWYEREFTLCKELGLWARCRNFYDASKILELCCSTNKLKDDQSLLASMGLWDTCKTINDIYYKIRFFRWNKEHKLGYDSDDGKIHSLLSSRPKIARFLDQVISKFPDEEVFPSLKELFLALYWKLVRECAEYDVLEECLTNPLTLEMCNSQRQLNEVLRCYRNCDFTFNPKALSSVLKWMRDSGAWARISEPEGYLTAMLDSNHVRFSYLAKDLQKAGLLDRSFVVTCLYAYSKRKHFGQQPAPDTREGCCLLLRVLAHKYDKPNPSLISELEKQIAMHGAASKILEGLGLRYRCREICIESALEHLPADCCKQ